MKKIGKVITSCNDCDHVVFLEKENGKDLFAAVCEGIDLKDSRYLDSFLLATLKRESLRHFSIEIPSNCPLEDYKEENRFEKDNS